MDEHWMPVSEMCSMCSPEIEYDFIIKFENLAEEEKYFIERLELENTVLVRWENRNSGARSTGEVRDTYYNMLTENEIWQLYTFYKMDFDLFEYEVDPKYLIKYYKA